MGTQNKRLMYIAASVVLILLVPLIAMQSSQNVNWSLADFILAAILLFGTGFICEFIIRKVTKKSKRIALCICIIAILILIWIELAVGIFGSPIAGS